MVLICATADLNFLGFSTQFYRRVRRTRCVSISSSSSICSIPIIHVHVLMITAPWRFIIAHEEKNVPLIYVYKMHDYVFKNSWWILFLWKICGDINKQIQLMLKNERKFSFRVSLFFRFHLHETFGKYNYASVLFV